MARLIPNPTDVFRKIDGVVASVDGVLERVDGTLGSVDTTLSTVERTLLDVEGLLGEVRTLLVDLRDELEILHEVPLLKAQLADVHRWVGALAAPAGLAEHAPAAKKPGAKR